MAKNNAQNLSHHEQLRYDYLLKNVHYLSEREKAEFQYLHAKKTSESSIPNVRQTTTPYYDDYDYGYVETDASSEQIGYPHHDDATFAEEEWGSSYEPSQPQFTDQGLPIFPGEIGQEAPERARHQSRQEKRQEKRRRQVAQSKTSGEPKKSRWATFFKLLAVLLLVMTGGILIMFFKGMTTASDPNRNFQPAIEEPFDGQKAPDGTNILILGSDRRITQGDADARTDTIMVVNVGNKDKDIKMVSFMRDTLVNIPGVSETDYLADQKLNTAFNVGEQNNNQGAELMRETLKANFDINISYYMMVDFETFAEAIDSLFPSGVAIDASFATIDGESVDSVEVPDDLRMDDQGNVPLQTIKVGKQRMDGRTLLNYARFRKDDDGDFGRTKRQQQVMSEILKQVKNPTKLFTGSEALGKIYALTSTNVSYPYLLQTGLSSLTSGDFKIDQNTIPEQGDWIDEYDIYGGQGLAIDFEKYQAELLKLGFR
ncbi:LCP family protein [Streptococcus pluranimalium]